MSCLPCVYCLKLKYSELTVSMTADWSSGFLAFYFTYFVHQTDAVDYHSYILLFLV